MHKLRLKGDSVLKAKCGPVTEFNTDKLYQLIRDMQVIMLDNGGVGLAAPQVGEATRVIIVKKQAKKGIWAVINPEITDRSPHTNTMKEGCLSYPGMFKEVERPNAVGVKGQDIQGNKLYIAAKGMEARIFCHEIDHLEGKCIVGL
jgi:peptide deformylase